MMSHMNIISLQVFEDTRHLVQSAVDGYNVCIFAYGQTGSGKTHTIYGTPDMPGLTPRGIHELFNVLDRDSGKYTFSVSCYMLELYQDDLADLLLPIPKVSFAFFSLHFGVSSMPCLRQPPSRTAQASCSSFHMPCCRSVLSSLHSSGAYLWNSLLHALEAIM